MTYKNGVDVLPPKLLNEIQKYIQGELIYVPKLENDRASWGEKSGSKQFLHERNIQIFHSFKQGKSIYELAHLHCLSEDSIKKIIYKTKKLYD